MPFRFISGSDDFLVQRKAQEEWEQLIQFVSNPHAVEIIDGQAGNVDEVGKAVTQFISAVQTVSLFAPEKAIWFRNITFLADSVTGRAQETEEQVERLQELLADYDEENVRVLLSASLVDRRRKAYKWFQSNGESIYLEVGKDDQAVVSLIIKEAETSNTRFTANAAQILVELIGGNTRLALEETRKLVTYLGPDGGEITPELVSELVPGTGESNFFEAAEAFYSLDLSWTLEAIHRHFFAGHDARPLLSSLQNRNRLLIQLKVLEMAGSFRGKLSKPAIENAASRYETYFGEGVAKSSCCVFTQNPWYLSRLSESLRRLGLKSLLEFQEAFREAFLEIVNRPNEQEEVITATAVNCLSPLQARKA